MSGRPNSVLLRVKRWAPLLLLAGILLLTASPKALAAQSLACNASPSMVNISLPSASIAPTQANGLIGSPSSVQVTFNCKDAFFNTNNYEDDFTLMTGNLAAFDTGVIPPGGNGGIMFKTNVTGIEVQLTASQNQAITGSNGPNGSPGWTIGSIDCAGSTNDWQCQPSNVTATFTAQLVKTGVVTAGTVNSINLLQFFDSDYYCSQYRTRRGGYECTAHQQATPSPAFGTLVLNPVNVSVTGCLILTDPIAVTLPTVNASAFSGIGSTAAPTPFTIQLSCSPGTNLAITLAPGTPVAGAPGVIANTIAADNAQNVGVQIIDWGQNPITFGTPIQQGVSQTGAFNIPFYARYYQTGTNISGGNVKATATYTLTYE